MKRRNLLGMFAAAGAMGANRRRLADCGCAMQVQRSKAMPPGSDVFKDVGSNLRITNMRVFGVTLDERIAQADRPYVFVKLETNQGVVGWGEATLEGKASAAMACVMDLKDYIIGSDPMQVEHLWQLMYIGSFYRGGPVLGSAISGIDQALWDIRGKVMNLPVYEMLGGPVDARGVRGYYHAAAWSLSEARELRDQTRQAGVTALKFQLPDLLEWVETGAKIKRAVRHMEMLREGLGPDLDFAVDFHARPSPTVAAIILREIEPLHLLFAEEICPPENVRAMARAVKYSTTPIATGERLIASYGCAELIDLGVVDILQPDIAHVGGRDRAMEGVGRRRGIRHPYGSACVRGPDWRHRQPARGCGRPQFPGAGDLRLCGCGRKGQGVGGSDGLPGHAYGGWPLSASHAARSRH